MVKPFSRDKTMVVDHLRFPITINNLHFREMYIYIVYTFYTQFRIFGCHRLRKFDEFCPSSPAIPICYIIDLIFTGFRAKAFHDCAASVCCANVTVVTVTSLRYTSIPYNSTRPYIYIYIYNTRLASVRKYCNFAS